MFDPYHKWLGIPPKDQPPNHYRLLGVELFEADPDVIDAAANKQMAYIQGCANGPHLPLSQKLLNEIAAARLCLLDPKKQAAYDAALKTSLPKLALATPVSGSPSISSQQEAITAGSQAPASPKSSQKDRESFDTLVSQPDIGIRKLQKRQSKKWPVILCGFFLGVIGLVIVAVYSLGILNPSKTDKRQAEIAGKNTPEQIKKKSQKQDGKGIGEKSAPAKKAPLEPTKITPEKLDEPPLLTKPNGLLISDTVDCSNQAHRFEMSQSFDITKSWAVSIDFQLTDFGGKDRLLLLWGDERPGRDPIFLRQVGPRLGAVLSNCDDNTGQEISTDITGLSLQSWHKVTFCYFEPTREAALYLNGKLIQRDLCNIVPANDRPQPVWLGGSNATAQRFQGKLKNVRVGNLE